MSRATATRLLLLGSAVTVAAGGPLAAAFLLATAVAINLVPEEPRPGSREDAWRRNHARRRP